MISRLTAADEQLHVPGRGEAWTESFGFEFGAPDGVLGGFVVMTAHPHAGRSWCWSAVAGRDRALCAVDEPDAPLPRRAGMELRAPALWIDVEIEIPFVHATVSMEAFGVVLEDPEEALRTGYGERVPFGVDLEWDSEGIDVAALDRVGAEGYEVTGRVIGEVLLGAERHEIDAPGRRWHRWGLRAWWDEPPGVGIGGVDRSEVLAHAVSAVPFVSPGAPDPVAALAALGRDGWVISGHPASAAGGMTR